MKSSLFGAALLLCLPVSLLAQETVSQKDYEKTVQRLHEAQQNRRELREALDNTRLQQLAMVVHFTSQEKSSLLLNAGIRANPRLGRSPQMEGGGNPPYLTLYPTTSPRPVLLAGFGECRLLGVARMSVGARLPGGAGHCDAGSYLLALKMEANRPKTLTLLDIKVDERGNIGYREALQVPLEQSGVENAPELTIRADFPGREDVSKEHPAWQVKVDISGAGVQLRFRLDMDITML
jgi:hypothetical protein